MFEFWDDWDVGDDWGPAGAICALWGTGGAATGWLGAIGTGAGVACTAGDAGVLDRARE